MNNNIEKLINNVWINYHPATSLFTLDLLHDKGSSFSLDLSNSEDLDEFNHLINFLEKKYTDIELENTSSTLRLSWITGHVEVVHDTTLFTSPFNNPIDRFNHIDVTNILDVLKRIHKLT